MTFAEKHRLSSTSALVLKWVGDAVHALPASRAYLGALDLSAADELFIRCDAVWPHYGEVIRNRKYAVLDSARGAVREGVRQIVILGAGFDALAIELATEFPALSLFDVDRENMDSKAALLAQHAPSAATRIKSVTGDLADPALLEQRLCNAGWDRRLPSLVVAEGISYYLSHDALADIFRLFHGPENRFVIEYLVEASHIDDERREVPDGVFSHIMDQVGLQSIARYTPQSLSLLAQACGFQPVAIRNLHGIEKTRTGQNVFFPAPSSGWIEIALLKASSTD